jgi:hypothetical protein
MIKLAMREGEQPLDFLQRIAAPFEAAERASELFQAADPEKDTEEVLVSILASLDLLQHAIVVAAPNKLRDTHIFATFPVSDERKWIRVVGPKSLDIGIMVGDEGLTIDVWNIEGTEIVLDYCVFWDEIDSVNVEE